MNPTYRITSPLELFNKIHILLAQIHLNVRMSIDSRISRTSSFAKISRRHIEGTCIFLQRRTYQWKNLHRDRSYRSFFDTQIIEIHGQDTHSLSLFLRNDYSERTQVLSNQPCFSVSCSISSRIASRSCSSIDQFFSTSKALDSIDDCQSTTPSLFTKLFRSSKKNNDVYVRFERR